MGNWTKFSHLDLPRLGVWVTGSVDPSSGLISPHDVVGGVVLLASDRQYHRT